jgi:hypothetical protein
LPPPPPSRARRRRRRRRLRRVLTIPTKSALLDNWVLGHARQVIT